MLVLAIKRPMPTAFFTNVSSRFRHTARRARVMRRKSGPGPSPVARAAVTVIDHLDRITGIDRDGPGASGDSDPELSLQLSAGPQPGHRGGSGWTEVRVRVS